MVESALLRDLSVIMVAAAITTLGCHWLKQPVVIGYLLAGFIIGPHTPPFSFVTDTHSIETLAELGLVFLMFAVGLEFHLPKLRRVGLSATLAAFLEITGMLAIGYGLGRAFGWSAMDSIFLGAILSISSTTIIAKVLTDLKLIQQEFAQLVFGILILEDLMAIVILAVLSGLGASLLEGMRVMTALGQVAYFVILFLVFGLALVPKLLRAVGRFHSRELLGIVVLGLCLASALLANHLGFSVALGAFMMGSIIGVSSEVEEIEPWIHPIRDMFSAIFFVATGLMINPALIMEHKVAILVVTLVTIGGKVFSGAAGSFLAGYSLKTSVKAGVSLAQIGEFSFVFAALALQSKRGSDFLYPLAVAVSTLTSLSTPYLIQRSDRIVSGILAITGDSFQNSLARYHRWVNGDGEKSSKPKSFLSRYIIRLAIYASLFVALLSLMRLAAAGWTGEWTYQAAGWNVGYWVSLPLAAAMATYISHFLLILVAESLAKFKQGRLLERLPIPLVYGTAYTGVLISLSLWFWVRSIPYLPAGVPLWSTVGVGLLSGLLMKRLVLAGYQKVEGVLDEALGLATAEPLRQAALNAEEGAGLLGDSIERLLLEPGDRAIHGTIRSLGLREKSGASIIGIYRKGVFHPNPSPEERLQPHDTLVLLGDKSHRAGARRLLKKEAAS